MESKSPGVLEANQSPHRLPETSRFLALPLRRFRPRRYRPGNLGTWSGHLSFANDLIATLRPAVLVELGTHYGESYFGFCQSVEENRLDCKCWAIDTWRGDEHAGFYDESVYQEVAAYNTAQYRLFSQLLRTTFDTACDQFADGSIDLLHIDGLHTFDAVKQDFDRWFPKVRPGGIVLIHDINVRHANFQVWRLWDDLKHQFHTFEFNHWWGLGVLQKPGNDNSAGSLADLLFSSSEDEAQAIREQYGIAAEALDAQEHAAAGERTAKLGPLVQVFAPSEQGNYSEEDSVWTEVEPNSWQHHVLQLPQGSKKGVLRLDLINSPSLIDLAGILIRNAVSSQVILHLSSEEAILALPRNPELILLPRGTGPTFFSTGFDPHLALAAPEGVSFDVPIVVELWMRVTLDLSGLAPILNQIPQTVSHNPDPHAPLLEAEAQRDSARAETSRATIALEAVRAELQTHHAERLMLHAEHRRIVTARDTLSNQNQQLRQTLEVEQNLRLKIEAEWADAQRDAKRFAWENDDRQQQKDKERNDLVGKAEALEVDLDYCKHLLSENDRKFSEFQKERQDLKAKVESLEADTRRLASLRAEYEVAQTLLLAEKNQRQDLLHSYSWKLTGPLRSILGLFRPEPKGKSQLP